MNQDEIKWPVLFPLDRSKGELADIVICANKTIEQLEASNEKLRKVIEATIKALKEV